MNDRISPSNPRLFGDGALPWQRTAGEYSAMQLLNSGRQEVDDRAGFCCCLHRLGTILRSVSCRQDDRVFAPQDRDFVRPKSMPGERRVTHTTTILRICLLRMPQSPQASLADTGRLCCPDWSDEDPQVFRHRPGMAPDRSFSRFPPCCCLLAEHGDFPDPTLNKGFS